jgi:hypothetical protein
MVRSTKEVEKFIARYPYSAEMAQRIWSGWSETVLCVTGQVGLEQAKALAEAAFCLPGLRQAQRRRSPKFQLECRRTDRRHGILMRWALIEVRGPQLFFFSRAGAFGVMSIGAGRNKERATSRMSKAFMSTVAATSSAALKIAMPREIRAGTEYESKWGRLIMQRPLGKTQMNAYAKR